MAIGPAACIFSTSLALASSAVLGALQLLASSAAIQATPQLGRTSDTGLSAEPCFVVDPPRDVLLWNTGFSGRPGDAAAGSGRS